MTTTPKPLCLSDFGIKTEGNTVKNICDAYFKLRDKVGEASFKKVVNEVYLNLMSVKPGTQFHFTKYFKGDKLTMFMVIACLFICENSDYCFADDYCSIQRDSVTTAEILEKLEAKKKRIQQSKTTNEKFY